MATKKQTVQIPTNLVYDVYDKSGYKKASVEFKIGSRVLVRPYKKGGYSYGTPYEGTIVELAKKYTTQPSSAKIKSGWGTSKWQEIDRLELIEEY